MAECIEDTNLGVGVMTVDIIIIIIIMKVFI